MFTKIFCKLSISDRDVKAVKSVSTFRLKNCQTDKIPSKSKLTFPVMTLPIILDSTHMTLTKFIFAAESHCARATGELTELLNTLGIISKSISAMLRRGGLTNPYAVTDKQKDKEPKKIQTIIYEIIVTLLTHSKSVGIMITDDNKKVIEVEQENKGKYIVTFDCLNGRSNVDVALTVGTIFGIMLRGDGCIPGIEDAIQSSNKMIAAAYALYGSATLFVFSTGNGVNEFVLDPQIGEFLLVERNIMIKRQSFIYSINEAYTALWDDAIKEYMREKKYPDKKKQYKARYVGSLVADIHRTIKHGGIYLYPANKDAPHGKLNLLCECRPMAFLMMDAGGWASNGHISIMEVTVKDVHQKSPLFIGDPTEVQEVLEYISKHASKF